ncbi:MAG: hypothetical protein J1F35_05060 [Erysipelotrichales bacterium]|nr:hypothetical protein [Erysipelotrichales bacterium]
MEKLNFDITNLKYSERDGNLDIKSHSNPPSTKYFPIYGDRIFKPLSYTKPLTTPIFCYAEVFWSYYIKKYFYTEGLTTNLALCEGITDEQPKYRKQGVLVDSYLNSGEKDISIYEYFNLHPDEAVNINDYVNYCLEFYDYIPIFMSKIIKNRQDLGEELALLVLLSLLTMNENFHYENNRFICSKDGEILRLNPPFDNEFSLPFLFPESQTSNAYFLIKYIGNMDGHNVLGKNLRFIAEHYPNVCHKFLDGLVKFDKEIKNNPVIIEDNSFIGNVSSAEYNIYQARLHEHDEEAAKKLIKKIKLQEINYFALNSLINKEIQANNEVIQNGLEHMLKLN